MKIDQNLHQIQAEILKLLLFRPAARFSDLNISGLTNDHFTFHIKSLVESGLVEKVGSGYGLTAKGKEYANRLDTDTNEIERQAKTAVLVVGVRQNRGDTEYLVQRRLKQPFYGFYGFVSGKVRWGELIEEAALREFVEETGMVGKPRRMGIEHKIDIKDGLVQEDKYFYVCRMDEVAGDLIESYEGGENLWVPEKGILKLPKLFGDIPDIVDLVNDGEFRFIEKRYLIDEY